MDSREKIFFAIQNFTRERGSRETSLKKLAAKALMDLMKVVRASSVRRVSLSSINQALKTSLTRKLEFTQLER